MKNIFNLIHEKWDFTIPPSKEVSSRNFAERPSKDITHLVPNTKLCPIEATFNDFNQKTPLHLVTKSNDPHFISDSIS